MRRRPARRSTCGCQSQAASTRLLWLFKGPFLDQEGHGRMPRRSVGVAERGNVLMRRLMAGFTQSTYNITYRPIIAPDTPTCPGESEGNSIRNTTTLYSQESLKLSRLILRNGKENPRPPPSRGVANRLQRIFQEAFDFTCCGAGKRREAALILLSLSSLPG